jgi:hypothetical protein
MYVQKKKNILMSHSFFFSLSHYLESSLEVTEMTYSLIFINLNYFLIVEQYWSWNWPWERWNSREKIFLIIIIVLSLCVLTLTSILSVVLQKSFQGNGPSNIFS